MDDISRNKLKQAYELLKMNDAIAARPLIKAITQQYPDSLDAWWLAVQSAESPEARYKALKEVLRIKPEHEKAQLAIKKLKSQLSTQQQNALITQARPLAPIQPITKRRKAKQDTRRRVWIWRLTGMVSLWVMSLLILDSFLGWGIFRPIEYMLLGEPEAQGYVSANGGKIDENLAQSQTSSAQSQGSIPIVKSETLKTTTGGMQIDTIYHGEAHTYAIPARAGMELMIAVNFLNDSGAQNVEAIEIWDADGRLVARETRFGEFMDQADMNLAEVGGEAGRLLQDQFNAMLTMRMITYSVPHDGHYTIAIISRDGGPAGQYSLLITNENAALDGSLLQLLN